jgi:hypothetical protein
VRPDYFGLFGRRRQEGRVSKVKLLVEVRYKTAAFHVFIYLLRDCLGAVIWLGIVEVEMREVGEEGRFHFFILDIFSGYSSHPRVDHDLFDPVH